MDVFTTIFVAFGFFLLAMALVAIGWLITGKMRVRIGTCGRAPNKKKDDKCGNDVKCGLCGEEKKEDDVQ